MYFVTQNLKMILTFKDELNGTVLATVTFMRYAFAYRFRVSLPRVTFSSIYPGQKHSLQRVSGNNLDCFIARISYIPPQAQPSLKSSASGPNQTLRFQNLQ